MAQKKVLLPLLFTDHVFPFVEGINFLYSVLILNKRFKVRLSVLNDSCTWQLHTGFPIEPSFSLPKGTAWPSQHRSTVVDQATFLIMSLGRDASFRWHRFRSKPSNSLMHRLALHRGRVTRKIFTKDAMGRWRQKKLISRLFNMFSPSRQSREA